ncbi:hypothetical protein [Legionella worsleiensis]|nr:hypothetical protein [Legionella worsleiensis]
MMGTTRHFKSVAEIRGKFSAIESTFKDVMARELLILNTHENPTLDKEFSMRIIDDFERKTDTLKQLREDLRGIKTEVTNRGKGFFKHGNIKNKLDQIITGQMIQELRTEMKKCVRALRDANYRNDHKVWSGYIKEYNDKYPELPRLTVWEDEQTTLGKPG